MFLYQTVYKPLSELVVIQFIAAYIRHLALMRWHLSVWNSLNQARIYQLLQLGSNNTAFIECDYRFISL